MKRDYRKAPSPALGRDMELLVFGDRGVPVIVFPTSMGRFYQWEDFGMVAHLAPRIEAGLLQLWCVDSVDGESFYNKHAPAQDRARRHLAYDRYLRDEVVPAIRKENPHLDLELLGASFGAFHAVDLATRHPGIASRVTGLSGAYDASRWLDGLRQDDAFFVNPLAFLPTLSDERQLKPLRETEFVIATGIEDPNVEQSRQVVATLQDKGVPATLHQVPMRDLAEELLAFVDDVLDPLGSRTEVEYLRVIAREGSSADRQIRVFKETGHLHAVVDSLALETVRGVPVVSLA